MKLLASHQSDSALILLCGEAIQLLAAGRCAELEERFGYAVALGRTVAAAIQADLVASLAEVGGSRLQAEGTHVAISQLDPNDSGLLSVVECLVPADPQGSILVEFVVSTTGTQRHLTLEQISSATGQPRNAPAPQSN